MAVRPASKVRHADAADVDALIKLTNLARAESPLTAQLCTAESSSLENMFHAWMGYEGSQLLVAEVEGAIVGFALVQTVGPNLYSDVSFIQIEGMYVQEGYRRRGLARAILTQVARLAEEKGIEHIVTIVLTGSRQELRFLSGLGFAPAGARRIVDLATLNRRLMGLSMERRVRGIDELIARRRRSRDTMTTG